MSIMLDLIGSMVVRGAIMLTFLYLTINMQSALYEKAMYAAVKQKTVVPAQVLTDDLRLAGYGPATSKVFPVAYQQSIEFYADINNDSVADLVHYYLGPVYAGTTNHYSLYREVSCYSGGAPFELARDVDSLAFTYYNSVGAVISPALNVSGIKSIRVRLSFESNGQVTDVMTSGRPSKGVYFKGKSIDTTTSAFQTHYVKAVWERVIFPQNL